MSILPTDLERSLNLKLREICDSIKKIVVARPTVWMITDINYISNIYDKEVFQIIRAFTQQAYQLGTEHAANKVSKEPYLSDSDLQTIKAMSETSIARFWGRIDLGIIQQQPRLQQEGQQIPYSNDWLVDSLVSDIIYKAYNLAVKLKTQKLVD